MITTVLRVHPSGDFAAVNQTITAVRRVPKFTGFAAANRTTIAAKHAPRFVALPAWTAIPAACPLVTPVADAPGSQRRKEPGKNQAILVW